MAYTLSLGFCSMIRSFFTLVSILAYRPLLVLKCFAVIKLSV